MINFKSLCSWCLTTAALLFLSGCRTSTDPGPAFAEVQRNVAERTGQMISWDRENRDYCAFSVWLEETLQSEISLDQAIEIALLNNHSLKAIYSSLGIAQAQLVQATLLNNPVFSYSLKQENFTKSANILDMGIVQNLLDILLKPLKKRLARTELELAKGEVVALVLEVIAETKIAFYTLQTANQALALQNQLLSIEEAAYDAAQRLHEAGNITDLELCTKRSSYEQMKIDVSVSEVEAFDAAERLNVLMGLWGTQINWTLSGVLTEIPDDLEAFSCIENQVIANSLDLKMARERMRATAISLGIEVGEIAFPELFVGIDSENEPSKTWFVGPQFSVGIPLFDIGQAAKASNHSELTRQWHEYTALAVEIRSAARAASFRLLNAGKQYRYYQEVIIPLEETITEETHLQLNAMQLGVFDLLQTKEKEMESKIRCLFTYRDYWVARAEVEMLLSGKIPKNTSMMRGP